MNFHNSFLSEELKNMPSETYLKERLEKTIVCSVKHAVTQSYYGS